MDSGRRQVEVLVYTGPIRKHAGHPVHKVFEAPGVDVAEYCCLVCGEQHRFFAPPDQIRKGPVIQWS